MVMTWAVFPQQVCNFLTVCCLSQTFMQFAHQDLCNSLWTIFSSYIASQFSEAFCGIAKHQINTKRQTTDLHHFRLDLKGLNIVSCGHCQLSVHAAHWPLASMLDNPIRSRSTALWTYNGLNESLAFYSMFWISTDVVHLQRCNMGDATCNYCHLGTFHAHHTTMHHVMSLQAKQHT